jgi:hypothetical protein
MAVEGRADYEERVARISILAGSLAPGPDTLKQTGGQDRGNLLRTGRAIR